MLGQLDLVFTTVIKIFICTWLALYRVAVRGVLGIEVMRQDKVTSAISKCYKLRNKYRRGHKYFRGVKITWAIVLIKRYLIRR